MAKIKTPPSKKNPPAKKKVRRKARARPVREMDVAPRYPWEQQPKETAKAFAAFTVYLEMHPEERSLRRVGEIIGKYYSQVTRWASQDDWSNRVRAHDTDTNRKRKAVNDREITKMHERQAKLAVAGQAAAFEAVKPFLPTEANPKPSKMRVRDAIRLFDVMARIERTSRGEPETISETRTPGATPETSIDDKRTTMLTLMEDPEALKAMDVLSKTLGFDGAKTDD